VCNGRNFLKKSTPKTPVTLRRLFLPAVGVTQNLNFVSNHFTLQLTLFVDGMMIIQYFPFRECKNSEFYLFGLESVVSAPFCTIFQNLSPRFQIGLHSPCQAEDFNSAAILSHRTFELK
jgi:hypothetical protein